MASLTRTRTVILWLFRGGRYTEGFQHAFHAAVMQAYCECPRGDTFAIGSHARRADVWLRWEHTGAWGWQEDEQLRKLVDQLGCKKWSLIASKMQTKASKQVRWLGEIVGVADSTEIPTCHPPARPGLTPGMGT
jgi:hypothetical protein